MIYAHFPTVTEVLETIMEARTGGLSWTEIIQRVEEGKTKGIESSLIIERIIPSQAQIVVRLIDTDVKLDIRLSTQDNASLAYEQAKKSEAKVVGASRQIEKTQAELDKIEETEIEPDRHAWYPQYERVSQQSPSANAVVCRFIRSRRICPVNFIVKVIIESVAPCYAQECSKDD